MNLAWSWVPALLQGQRASGVEQHLCRPKGQGLDRLAVLLLDRGIEKPSMILGFRMPCFQLSLVLYLSQVC
jgi:hypothetical protein